MQLNGFKSRVLRTEVRAQRHLYATDWRALAIKEVKSMKSMLLLRDEELASSRCERLDPRVARDALVAKMRGSTWSVVAAAVGTQRSSLARLPLFALEVALLLVQTQVHNTSRTQGPLPMPLTNACAHHKLHW